jgi:hypothetical protein
MARDINRCIGTKNRPCSGLVCRRISPSSQTSPRWQTGTPVADGEFDCGPRAAVEIEPNLRRQSLKNGNIRGHGRRPSPICASIYRFGNLETKSNAQKARISGAISHSRGNFAKPRTAWLTSEDSNLHIPI